jgi:hypothetical protein
MTNTASAGDPTIPAREPLRVLLVPADPARQVGVITVACSAAGLSAAIGGHLIDDGAIGVLPGGVEFALYPADCACDLPDNPRAAVLLARLWLEPDRSLMARLRGDVLVTGLRRGFTDTHVPDQVIAVTGHLQHEGPLR